MELPTKTISIMYRNYRKEFGKREIIPLRIWFGVSEYHLPEGPQWFLEAIDNAKGAKRDFAVKDIVGSGEWERLKDPEHPIEYDHCTAAELALGFLLEEKIGNQDGQPKSPLFIQDEIEGLLETLHVCLDTFEKMADAAGTHATAQEKIRYIIDIIQPAREQQFRIRNSLPRGHKVLEQCDVFESGCVQQTVRKPDGTEYLRIVSYEEGYGPDQEEVVSHG